MPGTQPAKVSKKTITIEPQPLSKTAIGGKNIANKTLQKLIVYILLMMQISGFYVYKYIYFTNIKNKELCNLYTL